MSAKTIQERETIAVLQAEYERAWRCFTQEVESMQTIQRECEKQDALLESARARVEQARVTYGISRDALAAFLMEIGRDSFPSPAFVSTEVVCGAYR